MSSFPESVASLLGIPESLSDESPDFVGQETSLLQCPSMVRKCDQKNLHSFAVLNGFLDGLYEHEHRQSYQSPVLDTSVSSGSRNGH